MKVIVTGCQGQLGSQIVRILKDGKSELGNISEKLANAEVVGIDIEQLDILNLEATKSFMMRLKPDVVINYAAYTNVDGCESNKAQKRRDILMW